MAEPAAGTTAATEGWEAILDRLEAGISLAFAGDNPAWEPPADAGPIPPELAARAHRLLSAHLEAEQMLTEQRVDIGRHLGAVNSVPDTVPRTRLLDVSA